MLLLSPQLQLRQSGAWPPCWPIPIAWVEPIALTVNFAGPVADGPFDVEAQARAQQFRNGYFDPSGELWSASGELLAVTHQVVYYKE